MELSSRTWIAALAVLLLTVPVGACSATTPTSAAIPAPTLTPAPQVVPTSAIVTGDGETSDVPLPQTLSSASVEMSVNGALNEGSGVAFLSESEIHARLLVGSPTKYLQFDLVARSDDSVVDISVGQTMPGVIYGQDAVAQEYVVVDGAASNSFSLRRRVPAAGEDSGEHFVEGTLDVMVQHVDGETYRMTASFLLPASDGSEWDCDWQGVVVTNCRFVER